MILGVDVDPSPNPILDLLITGVIIWIGIQIEEALNRRWAERQRMKKDRK